MTPATRTRYNELTFAAREVVAASGVDISQPVNVLPLAKQVVERTGCGIDAAKRHVARAIRLARGEAVASRWGGSRTKRPPV